MAYITYYDYVSMYGEPPISETDFPMYAALASDIVDSITQYRIPQGGGFSALPAFLQRQVQKAAGAQVFYFTQIGLDTVLTGQTGQSYTVGKVSVSGGALAGADAKAGALMVSPLARATLEQTPLMERGVPVCSDRFPGPFWGM